MKASILSIFAAMRKAEEAAKQTGLGFCAEITASNALHLHIWDKFGRTITEKTVTDLESNTDRALLAIGIAAGYAQGVLDTNQPELPEVEFGPFVEIKKDTDAFLAEADKFIKTQKVEA